MTNLLVVSKKQLQLESK